jgi:ABC-type amino acid transport substrate-binding protein
MKLSIIEPLPVILFDTEDSGVFWHGIQQQVVEMVRRGRAPAWAADSIVITGDPQTVIRNYRERLQLF